MITAKEARNIADEAKRTGAFGEFKELEETLESFEPRIRRVCENGSHSTGFRLKFFDFLSDEQIKSFVIEYFSKQGFTVHFSEKVSRFFSLSW